MFAEEPFCLGKPFDVDSFVAACRTDAALRSWLAEPWLDPRPLRDQVLACGSVRYVVVDGLLLPARMDEIRLMHETLALVPDYPDLNYDAHASRLDGRDVGPVMEFLLHPLWHAWVAFVLGVELRNPGRTVIKARRHAPESKGFWVHTDRDDAQPKAAAALLYSNPDWRVEDGGLLQIWDVEPLPADKSDFLRWDDYRGRSLDFLHGAVELDIEVAAVVGLAPMRSRLVDSIAPLDNRLVLLDFQAGESYHSISPLRNRARNGIVQWLY